MSDYNFIIDIESRRLIADHFSTEAGTPPTVIFGDQPTVNVQLVESNNDNAEHPWKSVALTGQSIRIGVGSLEDATPSAYIELTADLTAASSVITEVRAGVLNTTNEIQRVQILDAVKGNYTITIAGETTTPLSLDASLEEITDAIEALASITADSVDVTGNPTDYRVEFDSSLADVGAITVNLDNITSRVGKTGTIDLHVEELLTLLDDETSVEATLEVVRWTTADVAGETVLQVPVTVKQDIIPDTVPGTTPLPGYATIDLDHINQSGAATGQVPSWNGSEWVPITASGTGDMLASVYDPTAVNADAFDMDNMVEGTNLILTAAERTKLGDQVLTDVIDKMAYNADDLTFDIDTGTGVVVQIGQELLVKARNVTGSTITNGSVVRINGASGDRPTITPAQADSLANISGIIGIVTADILNNAVGFVTVHGLVRGLDTSTYTEGDELFLSSSVAGGFTSTEPALSIPIGTVTFANPASGEIFANVDNQKHLLEFASDPTLLGNFSSASWKTALDIAAADVDFGTGTDSYVWTSDGAGGAAWEALSGGGDMLAATYDPTAVAGDAFAMDNMVEGATTKILTATERSEIAANTAASHAAVTVSDSAEIDLTLAGQDITASLIASSIDETKLDASVNASLDLADSASQPGHTHVISDITDNVAASTGVLTGGVLSTGAGATEYSISDGTGIIVDETGAITNVSWSGKSNITPTNIATSLLTWVSINSAGNVVEMTSPCSPSSRRSEICLGVIVHVDKATVDNVNNEQVVAFNPHSSFYDLADALGFINVSGNVFSANGANLNLNKAVGEIFATGSNYDTSATNPHIKTLAVLSALTFQYRFSDGSNGVTGIAIDPDNLDDGAGGTTAVGNNRWSVQRIYSFVSNNVKIQRGVEDFVSKADAIAGIASEAYVTEPSIAANGLLRGWLVVKKGATNLSDTTDAQFIEAGKLGEVGSAGGGGAGNVVAELGIAVSDETTALTTGTAKGTFRMPYAMTVTDVRATVSTAPTGANIIVDINDGGTSIMTTNKLSIDATEKTSTTAATAPGVTDTALADDAEITIDIDQIGSTIAGAGLKIWIIGTRA